MSYGESKARSYARSGQDGLAFDRALVIGRLTLGHSTSVKAIAGPQTTVLNHRFTLMLAFTAPAARRQ